jgi:[ribosomal protein S5]-alanine N-acetyltransferase
MTGTLGSMMSSRLTYQPLAAADADVFHALATDSHVRRYLLDGMIVSREWAADAIATSTRLFREHSVGIWLAFEGARAIGFCGFRVIAELEPHPQLLYALLPDATGRGLASEMAKALVDHAADVQFAPVRASVDEVNAASIRVLEKTGFQRCGDVPGEFGRIWLYER